MRAIILGDHRKRRLRMLWVRIGTDIIIVVVVVVDVVAMKRRDQAKAWSGLLLGMMLAMLIELALLLRMGMRIKVGMLGVITNRPRIDVVINRV